MSEGFTVRVDQSPLVADTGGTVDAIISVTPPPGADPSSVAEVILLDCSASMAGARLVEARRAAHAAIDLIRDGSAFAIVAGTTEAEPVYPNDGLAVASDRTRAEAKVAVAGLRAAGGTRIGSWLTLANALMRDAPAGIRYAILLTDGKNLGEPLDRLRGILAECRGAFVCDPVGFGDDWDATVLRTIAEDLLGSADGVTESDLADLADRFQAMTGDAMSAVGTGSLRMWTAADTRVRLLDQVYPRFVDLLDRRVEVGEGVSEYPVGIWTEAGREFHLRVEVPAGERNETTRVAGVFVLSGEDVVAEAGVLAEWADPAMLSARSNARVTHYAIAREFEHAVRDGLAANDHGDVERAVDELGRAGELAIASGDSAKRSLILRLLDVRDDGSIVPRRLSRIDRQTAEIQSAKSVRPRE